MDYLVAMQKFLTYDDVPHIKKYIKTNQWWDTIDGLDRIVGNIAFFDERINNLMLEWSTDDDFWVRRIAIDHQLCRKDVYKRQELYGTLALQWRWRQRLQLLHHQGNCRGWRPVSYTHLDEGLNALMRKYGDPLTLYIDGYLHDVHEAEELMLDVFAYLFTKKPRIRDGGFKAYLYKACLLYTSRCV